MVQVLMATYNGEKYIREQMESLLNQNYQDIKITIRDDGSSDNTLNILCELQQQNKNKIEIIKDDVICHSPQKNFMELVKHITEDYIMFCDQDDIWMRCKIKDSIEEMQELETKWGKDTPLLVFTGYEGIDDNHNLINLCTKITKNSYQLNKLLVENCVVGSTMLINKALGKIVGEYDDRILMHDHWIALIAASCGHVSYIESPELKYRQHKHNASAGIVNSSSFSYLLKKLFDKNKKKNVKMIIKQAQLLKEHLDFNCTGIQNTSINALSDIEYQKRIRRPKIIIENKLFKSSMIRTIGFIITLILLPYYKRER